MASHIGLRKAFASAADLITNSSERSFMILKYLMISISEGVLSRVVISLFRCLHDRFTVTGEFTAGDRTYTSFMWYLSKRKLWRAAPRFLVASKITGENIAGKLEIEQEHISYFPVYGSPLLFGWNRRLMMVKMSKENLCQQGLRPAQVHLTIYPFAGAEILQNFVEECRTQYLEAHKDLVSIYTSEYPSGFAPRAGCTWNRVKTQRRRAAESVILRGNLLESIRQDMVKFSKTEEWYRLHDVPYRIGFLLHGPPGTGKTSTIYALAGDLGLDIYSLSLSSIQDDTSLKSQVSEVPSGSILLIEDIDCTFAPPRNAMGAFHQPTEPQIQQHKSGVTLSGLLNTIDGIGETTGVIFFITTNHLNLLDKALMRPGRIDRVIEYKMATKLQASALFERIFLQPSADLSHLAKKFADQIPDDSFTIAQIQGFLLDWREQPQNAVSHIGAWVKENKVGR